jgi:hypothetical protein
VIPEFSPEGVTKSRSPHGLRIDRIDVIRTPPVSAYGSLFTPHHDEEPNSLAPVRTDWLIHFAAENCGEVEMSKKRYIVELREDEHNRLEELIGKGKGPAKIQLKARILLCADESALGRKWSDPQISDALGTYPMICACPAAIRQGRP